MAGQGIGCVMRCLFDLSNRIADRHGETNAAHHGKIREIIAHIAVRND